ncbi:MAG: hypothetical protein LLG02_07555 [Pelosinus sp.]|nr:hypothetical protein [Pelosinus sp.]
MINDLCLGTEIISNQSGTGGVLPGELYSKAIATSIRPNGNIREQQKAVASWLDLGFTVCSVNLSQDIPRMRMLFPKVKFYEGKQGKSGKGHIVDILTCLYQLKAPISAIASPYTYLFGSIDETDLRTELLKSIIYVKVKKLEGITASISDGEYTNSVIFLNQEAIGLCPVIDLCLEHSWWYLWILLVFLPKGYSLKVLHSLAAYEVAGNERLVKAEVLEQGKRVAVHIPPSFDLNEDLLPRYHQLLWKVAEKNTCAIKNSSQV